MADDLRSYLASQTSAVPESPDSDEPDLEADEASTEVEDETPDDALPSDDEAEDESNDTVGVVGADASEDDADPDTDDVTTAAAAQAATARAEAAEQREAQARQALNDLWARQAYQQLQDRWAGMDPEEAAADKATLVAQIAARRERAIIEENQQLRSTMQRDWDLRENRPLAIQHLTTTYALTPVEAARLATRDDPQEMERMAADFASVRKDQQKAARAKARQARINSGADRVGGSAGGARGTPPASTGNPLRDYLIQQTNATRR